MEKLWKPCVHNYQHSNRTHGFQQNRWKYTAIVRNPEVKQMCIPEEYIINSELIKIYKCFKAFSKFFFKLFCYLAEGSQRHFKWTSILTPVIPWKREFNPSAKALLRWFSVHSFQFFNFLEKTHLKRLCLDTA